MANIQLGILADTSVCYTLPQDLNVDGNSGDGNSLVLVTGCKNAPMHGIPSASAMDDPHMVGSPITSAEASCATLPSVFDHLFVNGSCRL